MYFRINKEGEFQIGVSFFFYFSLAALFSLGKKIEDTTN